MLAEEMEVQLMILTSYFELSKSKDLKTTQFHLIIKLGDHCEMQTLSWKEVNSKHLLKQRILFVW